MSLPVSVRNIINQAIEQNNGNCTFHLVRRKGDQEELIDDVYTGVQTIRGSGENNKFKGSAFNLLPDVLFQTELLSFWAEFHNHFSYPDFSTFYSKRSFCTWFSKIDAAMLHSLPDYEGCFISLLADRQFLFLEDNEHGNNPEYPPLSEIVRNPERYKIPLAKEASKDISSLEKNANSSMRKNAAIVLAQGFVPTFAHKRTYNKLKQNAEEIQNALKQRNEFIQRSTHFLKDGAPQFQTFKIQILQTNESPTETERDLSQLFHDFLYAAGHNAYVKKYLDFLDSAAENSLRAIISVNRYLEENSDIQICKALVFWRLFTQETTKLAKGELKEFTFKMPAIRSGLRLTRKTQAPTYRKIDCQIMLFDYLLKILPPTVEDAETETAYAKFQFHVFSRYNGYSHFQINNIGHLAHNSECGQKFNFNLVPDSEDFVDYLGGVIRHHILRCIPNDVRWLAPALPNNWNISSGTLSTLLLQDSSQFPKERRLTNRIYAVLRDKGKGWIQTYLNFNGEQSELIDQLNKWCIDYDLIFKDDIPSSDMEISDDKMKLLCSRLVLEYMLKERALIEVREDLTRIAEHLWGHLLLSDYESFSLGKDL